jgi:CheY-like chemotaxis protein
VQGARPDLVILDCLFGGENRGYPLLQQLKRDPRTAGIPAVLCTVDQVFLREHERELGWYGARTLAKPFDVDDLLDLVRDALQGRERTAS